MGSRVRQSVLLFCGLVLLAGCGELRPPGAVGSRLIHTVTRGDTLYSIAWQYGYDYRQVASWNSIDEPYQIFPGQELVIIAPDWRRIPDRPPPGRSASRESAPSDMASPSKRPAVVASRQRADRQASGPKSVASAPSPAPKPKPKPTHNVTWAWPTDGEVVERYADRKGRKGINIKGSAGQPVRASAAGNVVYSGDGLIGYGNLVIIKHDDVYLSAYAHNRKLLVKEGEKVRRGQKIAEMGHTLKRGSILHFEIRRNGKPVDPMGFLSPR